MKAKLLDNKNIKEINSSSRNKMLKKNVSISFINKFVSILLSYLLVPLTINYLNQDVYGIWLTLLSILSWLGFSDIGLGNGLRNKLTECLSKNDIKNARKYVSTAYIAITVIAVTLLIPLLIIIPVINWCKILNTGTIIRNIDLIKLVYVTTCFFIVNFILSIINQVYYAYQKSMFVGFIQIITNIMILVGIIFLKGLNKKSIVYLALVYGGATLITNIFFSILFFSSNKQITPSIKEFSKNKVSDILTLGIKFFVIQIAALVIFTTDNIVITQVIGPQYVTKYNVVQKLFGALTMIHTILVTPLWSAYTEAYVKKDYKWIKRVINKLNILMLPIILGVFIIYFSFDFIVKIWIGQSIIIPKSLIILVAIYTLISIWNNVYSYLLNGIGFLKISFWICISIAILNVPLCIYFSKILRLGIDGVVIANILCLSIGSIIQPIQTYIILNNKMQNSIFYK